MSLIVNTVMLWLTDKVLASFEISTRKGLFVSSLAITLVNGLFQQAAWSAAAAHPGYSGGPRWI
jgi:uncharacterized membrane protein YvlD (DUF360 family)